MRSSTFLVALAFCCSFAVLSAAANPVTVRAPNCPTNLYLTLPEEFIPPKTSSDALTTLHANKNRKTRYSYAYVSSGLYIENLGQAATILIGTTGLLMPRQGQLEKSDFVKLRQHMMENDVINDPRTSAYIERLKNGMAVPEDTEITIEKPILIDRVDGPNSFSTLMLSSGRINDKTYMLYTAGQMYYKSSCIVLVQIWLPPSLSVPAVRDIVSRFNLK